MLVCFYLTTWMLYYRELAMTHHNLRNGMVYQMVVIGGTRPPRANWYLRKVDGFNLFFAGYRTYDEAAESKITEADLALLEDD